MKREEAILILHGCIGFDEEANEALDMAIKALEREPCEDAISRAEAIRIASGYCHPSNIAKELEKLPSVLPEQKTGHWSKLPYMAIEADGTLLFAHECSSCNGIGYFRKSSGKIVGGLYCPNCGSKMNIKADSEVTE